MRVKHGKHCVQTVPNALFQAYRREEQRCSKRAAVLPFFLLFRRLILLLGFSS